MIDCFQSIEIHHLSINGQKFNYKGFFENICNAFLRDMIQDDSFSNYIFFSNCF
jgi:hypothetical protein